MPQFPAMQGFDVSEGLLARAAQSAAMPDRKQSPMQGFLEAKAAKKEEEFKQAQFAEQQRQFGATSDRADKQFNLTREQLENTIANQKRVADQAAEELAYNKNRDSVNDAAANALKAAQTTLALKQAEKSPIEKGNYITIEWTNPDTGKRVTGVFDQNTQKKEINIINNTPNSNATMLESTKTGKIPEPTNPTTMLTPSAQSAIVERAMENTTSINKLGSFLGKVQKNSGKIGGFKQKGVDVLSGSPVGQFFPDVVEGFSEYINALSPTKAAEFKAEMSAIIADSVRILTPEEGSRISDKELQFAKDAAQVLKTNSSYEQLIGSLPVILRMRYIKQASDDFALGKNQTYDLISTDREVQNESIKRLVSELAGYGLSADVQTEIVRAIKKEQQNLRNSWSAK